MTEQIDTQNVRQGKTGTGVSTVLIVSLLLASFAGFALYFYGEQTDQDTSPTTQSETTE